MRIVGTVYVLLRRFIHTSVNTRSHDLSYQANFVENGWIDGACFIGNHCRKNEIPLYSLFVGKQRGAFCNRIIDPKEKLWCCIKVSRTVSRVKCSTHNVIGYRSNPVTRENDGYNRTMARYGNSVYITMILFRIMLHISLAPAIRYVSIQSWILYPTCLTIFESMRVRCKVNPSVYFSEYRIAFRNQASFHIYHRVFSI